MAGNHILICQRSIRYPRSRMSFLKGLFGEIRRVLIIAIGGGGDIVGATQLYNAMKRDRVRAYLAAIPWERFTIDPIPGPLGLEDFNGNLILLDNYGIILGETYAIHRGHLVIPQVSRVWETLKTPIIIYDATGGYESLVKGIVNSIKYLGVDTIIGLDVGGDVLAKGFERELWSPLLDHLAISAIHDAVHMTGIKGFIGVFGLGGDGELGRETLHEYISELMRENSFQGAIALSREDYELLKDIVKRAHTEASLLPLKVFEGVMGVHSIREGTRNIDLNLEMIMTLFFTVDAVYKHSKIAPYLKNTRSIREAKNMLNYLGVHTEFDLEEEIGRFKLKKNYLTSKDILNIKYELIEKLRKRTH